MDTVKIEKDGKWSEINSKWLPRFEKDGWVTDGQPEREPKRGSEKVTTSEIAELIELSETKDELESLIKDAFGVDLDKRKGLEKLKTEAGELVKFNES